jgi:hypothetical protein
VMQRGWWWMQSCALAVVDPKVGILRGNFSASDARHIWHGMLDVRSCTVPTTSPRPHCPSHGKFQLFHCVQLQHPNEPPRWTETVQSYLSKHSTPSLDPISVAPSASFDTAVAALIEHHLHHVYVINTCGQPVGIVTMTDVIGMAVR